jgi:SAM-dependent methyltransferase
MRKGSGKRFSPAEIAAVCAAYAGGESTTTLAARYGKSDTAIRKVLTREHVPRRDASEVRRKWRPRVELFLDPGPEALYWIGVLLSDGWVIDSEGSPRVGVGMVAPHGEYLARFAEFLGSPRPPRRKRRKTGRDFISWSIRSRALAEALAPWGVVPRKSLNVAPHPTLADSPDFWRGMIDGDGYVKTGEAIPAVGITGTWATCMAFARWAHRVFPEHLATVQVCNRKSFCVSLAGEPAKAALRALYNREGPALAAKRLRALDALEKWKYKTFRVFSLGEILNGEALPLRTPTRDEADAAFTRLRSDEVDGLIEAGASSFRHYDGPLKARLRVRCIPEFNRASQFLAAPERFTCAHRKWRSAAQVWAEDKARIMDDAGGFAKVAARYLRQRAYVASTYNPGAVAALLRRFRAREVLDPCAGWGDRLVGAAAVGATYRGFDPNPRMAPVYKDLADHYQADASVITAPFESARLAGTFDCVFTCPPYWDTELYDDGPGQALHYPTYAAWRDQFYAPMIEKAWAALRPGGVFALTVANVERDGAILPLIQDAEGVFAHLGARFEEVLALSFRSRRGVRHSVVTAEPVLVYRKA